MKDELGGKIMTELLALRPKTHSYLRNKENENKIVIKQKLKFEDYKTLLRSNSA